MASGVDIPATHKFHSGQKAWSRMTVTEIVGMLGLFWKIPLVKLIWQKASELNARTVPPG